MAAKPVVRRAAADRDVLRAIDYYVAEAGQSVAQGFIDALASACEHIGRHPASGSPRYALMLRIPGLRSWPLDRYPHVVFYFERADRVEIWRVLHGAQDLPASLLVSEDP
jgi:toxin ParE1/3/4